MLIVLLHTFLVVSFSIRIFLRDDLSPVSRLAWFLVVAMLPILGSVVYFLFGETDLGHKATERYRVIQAALEKKSRNIEHDSKAAFAQIPLNYQPAFSYASSINGFDTTSGNEVELMPNPITARSKLIEDIDAAQHHVHVIYYIWLEDNTGTNLAHSLIRAAQRGVVCRAMADGLGSRKIIKSALWLQMKEAGVQLAVALPIGNPISTIINSRLDLRNHRKITVIDGAITYCGSQNCADPEFLVKEKYGPWIDIVLRIQGPVVQQNQLLFALDWLHQFNGDITDKLNKLPEFNLQHTTQSGAIAQMMGDGPTERSGVTSQLFVHLLQTAQKQVIISTPYFVPDASIMGSICSLAHRGIRVELIIPKRNDSWIVAAASRSYYKQLLESGVKIYEYTEGLLHSKTLTIDNTVCFMGSSNLDLRSFDLNYENNVLIKCEKLAQSVCGRQQEYIASSVEFKIADAEAWPAHKRIWNNLIATIGPVL